MGKSKYQRIHKPEWIPQHRLKKLHGDSWVFKLDRRTARQDEDKLREWAASVNKEQEYKEPIVLYLAFNKAIVAKVQKDQHDLNLRNGIQNSTFHSFGKSLLGQIGKQFPGRMTGREYCPNVPDAAGKKRRIIRQLLEQDLIPQNENCAKTKWIETLIRATSLAQNFGLTGEGIWNIREREEATSFEDSLSELLGDAADDELVMDSLVTILTSCQEDKEVDFDDMIWLPVVCDVSFPEFKWVLVDEAQDLNPCQILFLQKLQEQHPNTRFVVVGDPNQSIYAFRGADPRSFENLKTRLQIGNSFSLTLCRRCPSSHVELARVCLGQKTMVPERGDIGTIEFLTDEEIMQLLIHGTPNNSHLVLCRRNKPLVKMAYQCIRNGRAVRIKGENELEIMIQDLISRFRRETSLSFTDFVENEKRKMIGYARSRQMFPRVVFLEEYFDIVMWLYQENHWSGKDLDSLQNLVNSLFSSDPDPNSICFSSTHRAKGDEAETVFILQAELFLPEIEGMVLFQKRQELNCLYVALTRCRGMRLIIGRPNDDEADENEIILSVEYLREKIQRYQTE